MARMRWERSFRNWGSSIPLEGRDNRQPWQVKPLEHFRTVRNRIAVARNFHGGAIDFAAAERELAEARVAARQDARKCGGHEEVRRALERVDATHRNIERQLERLRAARPAAVQRTPSASSTRLAPSPAARHRHGARVGDVVTVHDSDGTQRQYQLAQTGGRPQAGVISITSPIGAALLGRGVGDEVQVTTRAGARRLRITSVERPGVS